MVYIYPGAGHTIQAPHIEKPERAFYVKWDAPISPTAEPGIVWAAAKRWAKVMAQTPGGALEVTRYHHFGDNFQLMLHGIDVPVTV